MKLICILHFTYSALNFIKVYTLTCVVADILPLSASIASI